MFDYTLDYIQCERVTEEKTNHETGATKLKIYKNTPFRQLFV
jgi:hypothetical protein